MMALLKDFKGTIQARAQLVTLLLVLGLIVLLIQGCGGANTHAGSGRPNTSLGSPVKKTNWSPEGARTVGQYTYDIIPQPVAFHTMHAGPNNTDNLWIAAGPLLALDWLVETELYIAEGPTFDNQGNLYVSPLFPAENISLLALDGTTGARNWVIEGDGHNAGGGAPLILNDPLNPGAQIIYHATYTEAMAIRPDGQILWRTPTGLSPPALVAGERSPTHSFGLNYHPAADAVVGVTSGGNVFVFDRATGAAVVPLFQLPGAPAVSATPVQPQTLIDQSNALTDATFGQIPGGLSFYSVIIDAIFGGGSLVTNYFAIDPNSSAIYIAGTMPDAADGSIDGLSALGAIYRLALEKEENGEWAIKLINRASFTGGTGSTPSISEDGSRLYVSDNLGNLLVLDSQLREIWRVDLGEPIVASIAVAPDNHELYAVTRKNIFKLIDHGPSGAVLWTADLTAFDGYANVDVQFNALTPTITANGVAIMVGGGKALADTQLMLHVGVGLLDRETGKLRSFSEGREESIAVTSVGPDGSVFTANSPVRRVAAKVLFPELTPAIIGGISRYKPVRQDLLARDALCAAFARARNASMLAQPANLAAINEDIRQIAVLLTQAGDALRQAHAVGDLASTDLVRLHYLLVKSQAQLAPDELAVAAASLENACAFFD